jgi:hypothetical protein
MTSVRLSSVVKQLHACTEVVRKFKNHPAVLLRAIGNHQDPLGMVACRTG